MSPVSKPHGDSGGDEHLPKIVLVAVGGNSLIRSGQRGTIREQLENARLTAGQIAELALLGYRIVITHGNGPQVGSQLLRSEAAASQTYSQPLDICVAATQGEIGYIIQNSLQSELRKRRKEIEVVTVVTQVVVDKTDPAFRNPSKPIGPFYHKEDAERKRDELGWAIIEDAARGYRRIVPSPSPVSILENNIIRKCLDQNIMVIAVGGGGIPVIVENEDIQGVEAVVDKDRSSAVLANELGVSYMIISTDVDFVYLDYKKSGQVAIDEMSIAEAKNYLEQGQFATGSMRPKIESAIDFIRRGGEEVLITDPSHLVQGARGDHGTHIRR
jgi:carbamate kinase